MQGKNNTFFKGALSLSVSAIILKVIGLIYKVPLSYILGDEGMGYFNSAYTVYTFFYLIGTAGIPKAISIVVARTDSESEDISYRIYKVCLIFFGAFGALLSIVFFLLSSYFSTEIGNNGALFSMYSITPSILFVCASGVARGYLSGKLRFVPIAISELISGTVKLFLGLALAYYAESRGYSLPVISAYTIFGITVGSFLSLVFLLASIRGREVHGGIKIKFWITIREIVGIALPITVASSVSGIAAMLDLGLIMRGLVADGYSTGVSTILYGNYTTLALPMFSLVATVITPISAALMPSLTRSVSKKDIKGGIEKIKGSLSFIYFISIPCAFFYFFFPRQILSVIFEEGSAILGASLLSCIAPSLIILGPLTVMNTLLEAEGRVMLPVISLTLGSLTKLVSCTCLISVDSIGILAAPISTLISYSVSFIISYFAIKRSSFGSIRIFKGSIIPIFLSAFASLLGLFIFPHLNTCLTKMASCTILLLILGFTYLFFSLILSKNTRTILLNFVNLHKNGTNHL